MRRLWSVSVSLGMLLALFVAATGSPAGAITAFGTPKVVSSDTDDSEPFIVTTGSQVYITAIPGISLPIPSPSHIWRSTNGGASFVQTPVSLRALAHGGGDSHMAIDPNDGTLYWTDLWLGDSTVGQSKDKAKTWIVNPFGGPPVHDRQWIATPGGGRVYFIQNQLPGGLILSRSLDGGLTYQPVRHAATLLDQTGCICPPGYMVVDGTSALNDKVAIIFGTSLGGVKVARSLNGGLTFEVTEVSPGQGGVDTVASFPIVAKAGGSRLVAVWLEVLNNSSRVKMSKSTNWGATWSVPRTIVNSGTPVFPWVAAKGSKIAVSLFHTTTSNAPSKVPESTQWYEAYLESTDFGATFSSLVTVDPTPVKSGPICTDGLACDQDRELGDFQSLALDFLGRAHLTWARSVDNESDTEIRYVRQV